MSQPVTLDLGEVDIEVTAAALSSSGFAQFGSVIENPRPDLHPASLTTAGNLPFDPVSANQGSAIKYQHVTRMVNLYDTAAASRRRGEAVMNMFVCAARRLDPPGTFPVTVLERHPFTTQTFIPLSCDSEKNYLVIVAPSLPPTSADAGLPVPDPNAASVTSSPIRNSQPPHIPLPGRGLPDLRNLKAFIATAGQAVTYGAGTWHAPMVALGPEGTTVDFVVVQFANGVAIEDCQEVAFSTSPAGKEAQKSGYSFLGGDGRSNRTSVGVVVRLPVTMRIARL
ncbi:ureidoglycolate hydrolase [Coniochaeta sp. PMI_546]|nr:ureidoglycolate hydrolase [Coniochaeta sp. PMI_546]